MERIDLIRELDILVLIILLVRSAGCINPVNSIQITADDTTPHYRQIVQLFANINNAEGAVHYTWDFNNDGINDTEWSIKKTQNIVFDGSEIQVINCYAYDNAKNYLVTLSLTNSRAAPDFGGDYLIRFS